jgi:O-antigen ligase
MSQRRRREHTEIKTLPILHNVFAPVMPTTAPALASLTTIMAAIHTVLTAVLAAVRSVFLAVLAAVLAIVILTAHCQAKHAEDHQKTQHYCSL